MNIYNDFHSRGGAPDAQPFYTLNEHEEGLEAKLHALEEMRDEQRGSRKRRHA